MTVRERHIAKSDFPRFPDVWESGKMMFIVDIVILIPMIEDLRVSTTVMETNCVLTGPSVRPTKQDCPLPGRREYEELRGL